MQIPSTQPMPSWSTRQVVYATLLVAGVIVSFLLLYRFSHVVIILFSAIVLGMAIRPAVDWLRKRGLSPTVGVLIIYLALLALILGIFVLTLPVLVEQIEAIASDFPVRYSNFRLSLFQSRSFFLQQIALQLPFDLNFLSPFLVGIGENSEETGTSPTIIDTLTRGVLFLTAILVLGFYWTQESERNIRAILLWIPSGRRGLVRKYLAEIETKVGRFVLGQGVLCIVIGAVTLPVYILIGLPYALVLAILAGIMEAVPVFGPALGAVPALVVAFSINASKAIWVILATILIQGLENYLLVPRVTRRSVGVSPIVTLLSLATLTSLLGIAGALLAIPMAAIIQTSIHRFSILSGAGNRQDLDGRDKFSALRYEAQNLLQGTRNQLRNNKNIDDHAFGIVDSLEAMAEDIDKLLANASWSEDEE
ncbi:MAG TPA: AI-2E family transporter [Anaerolineales bacterium]|nr:AI-2E family transporter [Anaerolineales bacterium]